MLGSLTNISFDYNLQIFQQEIQESVVFLKHDVYCWDVNGTVELSVLSDGLQASYYEVWFWLDCDGGF